MKQKLIMTLLARDEEDIIENNICFHLNHGIDYILAIDNDSQDRTREIFKKYAKKGVLSYEVIKDHTHEQSKWISMLAQKAVKKHKATHLIHCDADEFWYPTSGDLRSNLPQKGEVFNVPVLNYLPEKFNLPWMNKRMLVTKPFEYRANLEPDRSYRMFLYSYPAKIMTTSEFTDISQGNHAVINKKPKKVIPIEHIYIHHFPIRSYAQFESKTVNGGSAYEKNPIQAPEMGWHKKAWYRFYKAGLLRDVYNQICINSSERKLLIFNNIIKPVEIPKRITYAKILYQIKSFRRVIKK
jgi:hypothetical protein